MAKVSIDKIQLAVQVARMYYECDENQQQIADKLTISRPQISRLLQLARDEGIVEITIKSPLEYYSKLEKYFCQQFGLKQTIIVPMSTNDSNLIKQNLARITANFLDQILENGQIIGVPWGSTLSYVAQYVKEREIEDVTIVQLKGGIGRISGKVDTNNPIITIARKLNAISCFLPVPSIVENLQVKEVLLSDKKIREILELGEKADIAVYPIGNPDPNSVLVQTGYFTEQEMMDLKERGAVGDICSRYFCINGQIIDQDLNTRTIGIELDKLRQKKYAIAVAGGKEHAPGILGALQGEFLNVLITDETAALEVLKLAGIEYVD